MCLLALMVRVVEDAPLVVGANREEYYLRGGEPPRRLEGVPAVAGVDPLAGGTWLGVNRHGVVVAVTNRRKTAPPEQPRSRGLLARDLLGYTMATEAVRHAVRALEGGDYAGCNFFCGDVSEAVVIHAGDWLRVRPLPPGIHILANRDVNDGTDLRVEYAAQWLGGQSYRNGGDCLKALEKLCASHEPYGSAVCSREADRGTVSSTLVALRPDLATGSLLHAQGPPDRTPYADLSHLLRGLSEN